MSNERENVRKSSLSESAATPQLTPTNGSSGLADDFIRGQYKEMDAFSHNLGFGGVQMPNELRPDIVKPVQNPIRTDAQKATDREMDRVTRMSKVNPDRFARLKKVYDKLGDRLPLDYIDANLDRMEQLSGVDAQSLGQAAATRKYMRNKTNAAASSDLLPSLINLERGLGNIQNGDEPDEKRDPTYESIVEIGEGARDWQKEDTWLSRGFEALGVEPDSAKWTAFNIRQSTVGTVGRAAMRVNETLSMGPSVAKFIENQFGVDLGGDQLMAIKERNQQAIADAFGVSEQYKEGVVDKLNEALVSAPVEAAKLAALGQVMFGLAGTMAFLGILETGAHDENADLFDLGLAGVAGALEGGIYHSIGKFAPGMSQPALAASVAALTTRAKGGSWDEALEHGLTFAAYHMPQAHAHLRSWAEGRELRKRLPEMAREHIDTLAERGLVPDKGYLDVQEYMQELGTDNPSEAYKQARAVMKTAGISELQFVNAFESESHVPWAVRNTHDLSAVDGGDAMMDLSRYSLGEVKKKLTERHLVQKAKENLLPGEEVVWLDEEGTEHRGALLERIEQEDPNTPIPDNGWKVLENGEETVVLDKGGLSRPLEKQKELDRAAEETLSDSSVSWLLQAGSGVEIPEIVQLRAEFEQAMPGASKDDVDGAMALIKAKAIALGFRSGKDPAQIVRESFEGFKKSERASFLKQVGEGMKSLFQKTEGNRKQKTVDGFYSPVRESVAKMGFKKIPAKDLLARIKKTPGVKKEEIDDLGLADWLDGIDGKVGMDEVLSFIESGGPKITELQKSDAAVARATKEIDDWASTAGRLNDSERYVSVESEDADTIFFSEKTSGDKWESVDPYGEKVVFDDKEEVLNAAEEALSEYRNIIKETGLDALGQEELLPKYEQYVLPGAENYREILFTLPSKEGGAQNQYSLSHWYEPNVLAHVRLNDRVGPDGERILFVEEIQSDWHQDGRANGYARKGESTTNSDGDVVPNAPFKKSWELLTAKRVLRMAVEQGYDSVAWTPGDVQAARYDLSKQVDNVKYWPKEERLVATKDGEEIVSQVGVSGSRLEDFVGKEVAKKLLTTDTKKSAGGGRYHELVGGELRVGGKGMKGFYDNILPKKVEKYIKKLDKTAKVNLADIGGGVAAWELRLSDKMRAKILSGQPLYQVEKGATQFAEDGRALIHFFESADMSTAAHEISHVYRRTFEREAMTGNNQALLDDWTAASEWVGAKVGEKWTREQEEKFARGFEKFLGEGVAPAPEVQGIFDRARTWMLSAYTSLSHPDINVKIDDKMRKVMDRLLATEVQIETAKEMLSTTPMLKEADFAELTQLVGEERGLQYYKAARGAEQALSKNIADTRTKGMEKARKAAEKLAREEWDASTTGKLVNETEEQGFLNKASVKGYLSDAEIAELEGRGVVVRGGAEVEDVAHKLNLDPRRYVEDILRAPTKEQFIKGKQDAAARMFEESFRPEDVALSRDLETQLTIESEFLAARLGGLRIVPTSQVKALARELTGQFTADQALRQDYADLKLHIRHLGRNAREVAKEIRRIERERAKAQTDAVRERLKKLQREKTEQALKLNEQRRVAIAEMRERVRKREETQKAVRLIRRSIKQKNVDSEFKERTKELLQRHGFKTATPALENTPPLPDLIYGVLGSEPSPIPEKFFDGSYTKSWRGRGENAMTFDEFMELSEVVRVLAHYGKNRLSARDANYKDGVAAQAVKIRDVAERELKPVEDVDSEFRMKDIDGELVPEWHPTEVRERWYQSLPKRVAAELTKPEFMFRELDGFKEQGPAQKAMYDPFVEAATESMQLGEKKMGELHKLFSPFIREMRHWKKPEKIGDTDLYLTKEQQIVAVLNMANKGNLRALVEGSGWGPDKIDAIKANLSKAERGLVEGIIKTLDMYDILDKAYYKLHGAHMPKVEGIDIKFDDQTIKGGYYPISPDKKAAREAGWFTNKEGDPAMENFFRNIWGKPAPKSGFTNARKGTKIPPSLSFDPMFSHVRDAIHWATHANAVRDVHAVYKHQQTQYAMRKFLGTPKTDQILPWLQNIAKPRFEGDMVDRFWGGLRKNVTVASLALNLGTVAAVQPLSYTLTINKMGTAPAFKALRDFVLSPKQTIKFVTERSEQIRLRGSNWDRELKEVLDTVNPYKGKFKFRVAGKDIMIGREELSSAMFYFIRQSDRLAVMPTWMAGYTDSLARNKKLPFNQAEKIAIHDADKLVTNTQPSAMPKDLAAIQRGGTTKKMFSMFYTFFSVSVNTHMEVAHKLRNGQASFGETARSLWWTVVVPATLAALVRNQGVSDEKDVKSIVASVLTFPVTGVPLARDLINPLIEESIKGKSWGYSVSPVAAVGEAVYSGGTSTIKVLKKMAEGKRISRKDWNKMWKSDAIAIGYATGLPVRAIERLIVGMDKIGKEGITAAPYLVFPVKK